jgi:hypothetical protein
MYKMINYNSCINIYYYFYNNIVLNGYLVGYIFFPNSFKDRIINVKKTIDICYNRILMVSFRDEIYSKYNIDVFDIYQRFQSLMITPPIKKTNKKLIIDNSDTISVMSSLSSQSSLSDCDDDSHSVVSLPYDFDDDI